jgi:hypothetical protein
MKGPFQVHGYVKRKAVPVVQDLGQTESDRGSMFSLESVIKSGSCESRKRKKGLCKFCYKISQQLALTAMIRERPRSESQKETCAVGFGGSFHCIATADCVCVMHR